jgi:uncharacterized protein YraI
MSAGHRLLVFCFVSRGSYGASRDRFGSARSFVNLYLTGEIRLPKQRMITALVLAIVVTGSGAGVHGVVDAQAAEVSRTLPPGSAPVTLAALGIGATTVKLTKVATNNLNLRSGRSTSSGVILTIPQNTKLSITEVIGDWSKTTHKNKSGWVSSAYLKNAPATTPTAVKKITTNNLNLRQAKSTSSKILLSIPKGATISVTSTSGTWSKTSYKSRSGWVASAYLKNVTGSKPPTKPSVSYRWTTANVNVRKGNRTHYASLGVVPFNERVTYISSSSGWSKVKTTKGTGWISSKYLKTNEQYAVSVYGTLRKGQSAYHLLRGRTVKESTTKLSAFNMYLKPNQTWWSFIVPTSTKSRTVVVERMDIKPESYKSALASLDKWERYDANKPLADQNYNRKIVTDINGRKSWAYLGGSKISKYLTQNGIRVNSGDYLKRY